MAKELSIAIGELRFTKGNARFSNPSFSKSIDVTGTDFTSLNQNIGTTDETLVLGDVGTIGYVFFLNTDATNYVDIGADGSSYPIRFKPGEFGIVRWNGAAIHAKANTAAINLQYVLIEA